MATKKVENESAQYSWIVPQEYCWIAEQNLNDQNSEVFVPAQILGFNKITRMATCQLSSGGDPKEIQADRLLIRNEQNETFDDMVNMDLLNEAELLQNLRKRYDENKIYTYVGPTLLAVNPFKKIDNLYEEQTLLKYISIIENFTEKNLHKKIPPHVYGLTAESFKDLFLNEKNQALVISGESGAGKTENTKYCMKFLTSLGNLELTSQEKLIGVKDLEVKRRKSSYQAKIHNRPSIEDKILSCNPILEAFGNAKTVRNDNSSRFGKYVTIIVNKHNKMIEGAQIINYLLEKARITNQGQGERSFHIFYHFLKGADKECLERYGLEYPVSFEKYAYLSQSKCFSVDKIDDIKLFQEVNQSFQILGFENVQDSIYCFIAAILLLGNLQFDDKTLSNDNPCSILNLDILRQVAKLLQIDETKLIEGFTFRLRVIQKQNFMSPLQKIECINTKDSLSKYLYERMFNLIVQKLNEIIVPKESIDESKISKIGLLDIYGFEVFKENGFEQFFINYTNEKLQQLYIQYVFKQEEQVFVKEGLESYLQYLSFTDNKPVIDLLDMPPSGIFNILDDICQTKGNDEKFLNKIRQTHKNNKYFQIPRITAKPTFTIVHSAKEVEYTATVFTEKNQDEIQELIMNALLQSKNELLSTLAQQEIEQNKNKKKEKSLGSKFRTEMQYLMNDLMACDCHFIRCIKPNEEKKANCFRPVNALQQVRYLGVLESIKVRKQSYPIRKNYQLFYKRYSLINQDFKPYQQLCQEDADFISLSKGLFKTVFKGIDGNGNILFGKSRIFMQNRALNDIEQVYENKLEQLNKTAKRFQKAYYTYKQLKKLRRWFQLIRICQQLIKVKILYKRFKDQRKKAQKIQNWYRRHLQRELIRKYRQSALVIQNYIKYAIKLEYFSIVKKNVLVIQKCIRKFLEKTRLRNIQHCKDKIENEVLNFAWNFIRKRSCIQIQKIIRGFLARQKHKEMIIRVKMVGRMIRERKAATKIQTNYRMHINRKKFLEKKKAAMKIQAFIKMKILSAFYKQLKFSTNKIQKAMRKFLIKKHIRLERLQSYVNQCDFKNLLSTEQSNSLGQAEENNLYSDVQEMYYIQKKIQHKRKNAGKKIALNNKKVSESIIPGVQMQKKTSIKPLFSSQKSQEQIFKMVNKQVSDKQSQCKPAEGNKNKIQLKQVSQQQINNQVDQNKLQNSYDGDHSLDIVNSNSCIDLQDILDRHQAQKTNLDCALKIEDQKAITNQSNVAKRSKLRQKENELDQNKQVRKSILNQTELQSNPPNDKLDNANQNGQEQKIQDMYYYTSDLAKIHNQTSPQKVSITSQILPKSLTSIQSPLNKTSRANESSQNIKKTQLIDSQYKLTLVPQKVYMISHLIDFEILSDTKDIYPPNGWSEYYQQQFQQSYIKKDYLQAVYIGETHTVAVSNNNQLYTWGWNDFGQLGTSEEIIENEFKINNISMSDQIQIEQASVGNDFTLVLSKEGKLFGWGKNNKGQLGFYDDEGLIKNVDIPMEIISVKEDKIKGIKCRMNSAFIILNNGSVYTNQKYSPYQKINFAQKVERVSCGFNFTIFLTTSHQIYSYGKNQHGQLGLGDFVQRKEPTLIPFFKTNQINQVECGFAHVVCQTNYGRVYVWGWGQCGQLGLGDYQDQPEPQLCNLNNLYKDIVIQVCATRTSTLLLLNNSDILWFGTNQSIKYQENPTIYKVSEKLKQLEGTFCMRLTSSWSKTLGVVYGTFAFSKDLSDSVLQSTCNTLTKKWVKQNIDQIKPPTIQSIIHKLPQQYIDLKESPKKPIKNNSELLQKTQSPQIVKVDDFSNISNIQEASFVQFDVEKSLNDFQQREEEEKKKLKELKNKIEFLKTLPQKQLRQIDKQLIQLYEQKQYSQILSNKKFFN
ncbi:hypothetical protein ABPG74_009013 [Tetrahymena malaccensis]